MANYCSNSVMFLGGQSAVKALIELFSNIEREQNRTHLYHLPDFIKEDEGYMQDISVDEGWINYETRSTPNLNLLIKVGERYQVGFISRYSEQMSGIYGEAIYRDGQLKTVDRNKHHIKFIGPDAELVKIRQEQQALLDFLLEEKRLPGSSGYDISC